MCHKMKDMIGITFLIVFSFLYLGLLTSTFMRFFLGMESINSSSDAMTDVVQKSIYDGPQALPISKKHFMKSKVEFLKLDDASHQSAVHPLNDTEYGNTIQRFAHSNESHDSNSNTSTSGFRLPTYGHDTLEYNPDKGNEMENDNGSRLWEWITPDFKNEENEISTIYPDNYNGKSVMRVKVKAILPFDLADQNGPKNSLPEKSNIKHKGEDNLSTSNNYWNKETA